MNVIKHNKRGGVSSTSAGNRILPGNSRSRSQGRGRGALDFDLIQYRPGAMRRGDLGLASSGEIRTPSNLELEMAISSSAYRNNSSSGGTNPSAPNLPSTSMGPPQQFAFGHSLRTKRNSTSAGSTSTHPGTSSSSSIPTRRFNLLKTPSTKTPKTSYNPTMTPRATPPSTSTSTDHRNTHVILAITEGRGVARGEVGMAVIDVHRPRLILCQLSDRQTYANTLTKINVFHPVEILVPHTFVDNSQSNKLYNLLDDNFHHVSMTKVQRRLFRDSEGLEKIQNLCLAENATCQLILQDKFYALAAAAALLKYVEFVQNVIFAAHSLKVEYQGAHHGTIIDVKTAQCLELLLNQKSNTSDHTLVSLMDYCCTQGGKRLLRASLLHPPCSLPLIERRQQSVKELVEHPELSNRIREILQVIPDVEQLLSLCMQTPSTIDNNQLIEKRSNYVLLLKTSLDTLPQLQKTLENVTSHSLSKIRECLQDDRFDQMRARILETINEDVKAPKGARNAAFQRCFAVKSGINDLIDVARRTYCELINDINDLVVNLGTQFSLPLKINFSVTKGYHIQIVIQRNRPVKESELPAVFVQVQRTRNSLTCTTNTLIHANERIKQVAADILSMSNTLLTVLLTDIRVHMSSLYDMCESIAELDLTLSLAQLSRSDNYFRPQFGDLLKLKASRHPILESITPCDPVANNVEASSWSNLAIITGPNMSGKSIYIRQVLLLQIMAQVGCYVPAAEATFRITDRIFSHLNFDDSIENNASTLALEMQEIQLILSSLTATSLVALDEICRGTSVEEGTALAWAICEELSQSTAFVFVTTHFQQLTHLANVYPCIRNIHLETREQQSQDGKNRLVYTHRLLPGITPVEHYGLRLAETFNVPDSILDLAKHFAASIETQSEVCVVSTEGDEEYTLARAFHKLKVLAEKPDLSADEFSKVQAEIKESLQLARRRTEEDSRRAHTATGSRVSGTSLEERQQTVKLNEETESSNCRSKSVCQETAMHHTKMLVDHERSTSSCSTPIFSPQIIPNSNIQMDCKFGPPNNCTPKRNEENKQEALSFEGRTSPDSPFSRQNDLSEDEVSLYSPKGKNVSSLRNNVSFNTSVLDEASFSAPEERENSESSNSSFISDYTCYSADTVILSKCGDNNASFSSIFKVSDKSQDMFSQTFGGSNHLSGTPVKTTLQVYTDEHCLSPVSTSTLRMSPPSSVRDVNRSFASDGVGYLDDEERSNSHFSLRSTEDILSPALTLRERTPQQMNISPMSAVSKVSAMHSLYSPTSSFGKSSEHGISHIKSTQGTGQSRKHLNMSTPASSCAGIPSPKKRKAGDFTAGSPLSEVNENEFFSPILSRNVTQRRFGLKKSISRELENQRVETDSNNHLLASIVDASENTRFNNQPPEKLETNNCVQVLPSCIQLLASQYMSDSDDE